MMTSSMINKSGVTLLNCTWHQAGLFVNKRPVGIHAVSFTKHHFMTPHPTHSILWTSFKTFYTLSKCRPSAWRKVSSTSIPYWTGGIRSSHPRKFTNKYYCWIHIFFAAVLPPGLQGEPNPTCLL